MNIMLAFSIEHNKIHLLLSTALVLRSLRLFFPGFVGAIIDLDVSGFLAIIVGLIMPGLAPPSSIIWLSGRTS